MADFLTTRGTSYNLEKIIIEAQKKLVLVSPFLQISKTLFERLKDASNKQVEIIIIYGKDDLKPNEKNSLAELKSVRLYYHENLHAKCFFNESTMIITSMNMYQFSENNNREMGVLIDSNNDKDLFKKATEETYSILKHSEIITLKKTERSFYNQASKPTKVENNSVKIKTPPKMGYCLRGPERIPYDPFKPFCFDCFSSWSTFRKPDYKETFCHCCGEFADVSMARPLCDSCFRKFPFM